jgi:CheY-like chemotaxis protein
MGLVAASSARCLIVEDDDWTRDYVTELLKHLGIHAEAAANGLEAAALLDEQRYDLVFLDLDLPQMPGEAILHGLVTSRTKPRAIALMSTPDRLARIPKSDWSKYGIMAALAKPLVAADIRASVAQMLGTPVAKVPQMRPSNGPGAVLIAGGGLWADALASVATKGGATVLSGRNRDEALSLVAAHQPAAVIAGPPLGDAELIEFCNTATQSSSASLVFAAVNRADLALRRALSDAGVAKVCIVPSGGADLAVAMINAARLTTRAHARVPLAGAATIVTSEGRVAAFTRDLSEGGLCLERLGARLPRGPVRVEFALPDGRRPLALDSAIAWIAGGDGEFRAGIRFEGVGNVDLLRIRSFIENQPRAGYSFG